MPDNEEFEAMKRAVDELAAQTAQYPKIPLPATFDKQHTVVIVLQADNHLGLDHPHEVIHGRPVATREGGVGALTVTVVVQDPVSKETLGIATTSDLPYSIDGQSLGDIPREIAELMWQGLSLMAVQRLMLAAFDHAGGRLIEELSGETDIPKMQAWAKLNVPSPDTPNGGMDYMLSALRAKREGKTVFEVSNYGQAVSHVTKNGWDAYLAWLGPDASIDAQLDRMPEYIKETFGVLPIGEVPNS